MEIPIDIELESFEKHLSSNPKVFFSGKYGIGKTTFLKKFFQQEQQLKEYSVVRLSPVNYSVSENHEIFELIKADILLELISQGNVSLDKDELPATTALLSYLAEKEKTKMAGTSFGATAALIAPLLNLIPTIGSGAYKMYEAYEKLYGECVKFDSEFGENPEAKAFDYLKSIGEKVINESDWVSQLISELISQIKGKSDKEVVLWIDDLDRIDPAHLFRILNIICAHSDSEFFDNEEGTPNKFGFHRIILTGDLRNIRSLFHHYYGQAADFKGYMDKFYDEYGEVYQFNFQKSILEFLQINKLIPDLESDDSKPTNLGGFNFIIKVLIEEGLLNTRTLLKAQNLDRSSSKIDGQVKVNEFDSMKSNEMLFPSYVKWLRYVYGDLDEVISTFDKLSKIRVKEDWKNDKCTYLVKLLAPFLMGFDQYPFGRDYTASKDMNGDDILEFTYKDRYGHTRKITFTYDYHKQKAMYIIKHAEKENDPELWKWFYHALLVIQKKGILS